MKITEIWRYPVKSMQGEKLAAAELTARGIAGDRAFAVQTADGRIGSAKNPRRFGRLFECHAFDADGAVIMQLPSGEYSANAGDAALSEFLGEPVRVTAEAPASTEIDYVDLEDTSHTFPPMGGTFFDTTPIHILFTRELERLREFLPVANLDIRRFRPNLVVEGEPVTAGILTIGAAGLRVAGPCPRCIMTTLPQPGGIPRDVEVLKTLAREMGGNFGLLAHVTIPGAVRVGDSVSHAD